MSDEDFVEHDIEDLEQGFVVKQSLVSLDKYFVYPRPASPETIEDLHCKIRQHR